MASRYGLQIRAAVPADAVGLASLMEACGCRVDAATLAARLSAFAETAGAALLAVEWGPPSGAAVVTWSRTLDADLPVATINLLLVGPEERRRGIGRLLLKAASQAARAAGCGTLVIGVPGEATTLHAFCDATGFEATGACYARALRRKG